jgi:hypothetical protein
MGRDKWNFVCASLASFSGMNCGLELCMQLRGPNFWYDVVENVVFMFPPGDCAEVTNTQMCTYLTSYIV